MSLTPNPSQSVYIVRIGKHIKIGFSRSVTQRMKAFETSSADVELLLAFDGDMALERRIHELLAEVKIRGELFQQDWRISSFIRHYELGGLEGSLRFLEETTPGKRDRRREEDRNARVKAARQNKAQKDAYFASLVADRKSRLGW
jgi:hypothetical protein